MADLICTDEEKVAASYLDWDDVALGRACKKIALIIGEHEGGRDSLQVTAAAMFLVSKAIDANAESSSIRVDGLRNGSTELGDWRITLERVQ